MLGSLIGPAARPLSTVHTERVAAVLAKDPVAASMVAERFEIGGMDQALLGGRFWGVGGGRDALAFVGGLLVPLSGDPASLRLLAHALGRRRRSVASIVGPATVVLPLWQFLQPHWGSAREVRADQPLLTCAVRSPSVPADPAVAPVGPAGFDPYLAASVAMFREEVGSDPMVSDPDGYRRRIRQLIGQGQCFAAWERDQVVFKADIGSLSRDVAMIQGVWVHPDHRGRGRAAGAVAAVVEYVAALGRIPALYVNAGNAAARATYARVGFRQVGTFASVLF